MALTSVKEIIKPTPPFASLTDIASERLGGKVLYATDDFFAEKENLLKPGRGIFIADKYTDRGKWMDGWESRRKRTPGHDYAVIKLAATASVTGFDIDTNFFLGNHPPYASVDGANLSDTDIAPDWENNEIPWQEILPKSPLDAGSQNFYACECNEVFTHLRLHIYPDGGVARFRAYGDVFIDWENVSENEEMDLVAALNGGQAIECNDMFFSDMKNLIMPGRGINMGDGWETKRNRTPGNTDWVILKLGHVGMIKKIIVDTCHFKGNYPDSCLIEACHSDNDEKVKSGHVIWQVLLPKQKLKADHVHEYEHELIQTDTITHVRFIIFPDGGISRLRLIGKIKK
ncbi:MAG: allantoicase [Saprospiraceae bacterium]|nr:allantoicase [Saprospiraceae bacterium]